MENTKLGISLISLVITIVAIIILAGVALFSSNKAPDNAGLAKFKSEFSDFSLAVTNDFLNRKSEYTLNSKRVYDKQIYYMIASGKEISRNEPTVPTGLVSDLNLAISPVSLKGTEYYEITSDKNVANWDTEKKYDNPNEKHYITDAGVVFVLPGYLMEEDGVERWYINEDLYYVGEGANTDNNGIVEPKNINDWEYTLDESSNTITITKYKGNDTEVVIPNHIGGVPVNAIIAYDANDIAGSSIWDSSICDKYVGGESFFQKYQNTITKLVISDGIEIIDRLAFASSRNLKEVIIPNSVTSIGDNAFARCSSLTNINIPNSVTSIGSYAFSSCSSLTNIKIPNSVTSIGDNAFCSCSNLTSVEIPNSVTSISYYAFYNISSSANIRCHFASKPSGWHSNWTNCTNITWLGED